MTLVGRSWSRVLLRMDRRIQQLEARVEKLERELKKSSHNSSRPPSSDPPGAPARGKDASGRKRGAQDGHDGHGRPLLPTGDHVLVEALDDGELRLHRGERSFEDAFGVLTGVYPPDYLAQLDAEDEQR